MLTKRELSILEENGWLVASSTPKTIFGVEEAKEEVVAIVTSKIFYKNLHKKEQEKKLKVKEKAIEDYKNTIGLIRKYGLTSDTLFEFYTNSCNFGFRFNPHSKELKTIFKEALGEK